MLARRSSRMIRSRPSRATSWMNIAPAPASACPTAGVPATLTASGCIDSAPCPDPEKNTTRPSGDHARPSSAKYSPASVFTVPPTSTTFTQPRLSPRM